VFLLPEKEKLTLVRAAASEVQSLFSTALCGHQRPRLPAWVSGAAEKGIQSGEFPTSVP